MNREELLQRTIARSAVWDLIVIGGGASGVGVAIDAVSRGYSVLLLEQHDFGKGTSSRSTKLVHGGVRYLEQGNLALVMEALQERGLLRQNAPHLVHDLAFVVPTYSWWESPFYGLGLQVYNLMSGKYRFGPTKRLSRAETLELLPTIKTDGLQGGVIYHDGQFDDARLLMNLVTTAQQRGGTLLNYAPVVRLLRDPEGRLAGVVARDEETGREFSQLARVVVNATGVFADQVRQLADPQLAPMVAPSQGIHLVFDRSFLPGSSAIMVPHTSDGRVLFAIPWHDHTLVGTTDVPLTAPALEPRATADEIHFILETAARYLSRPPTTNDILSVFAGIRPLIRGAAGRSTASLSREHALQIDPSGLITLTGGKWTTYRKMAEDCVTQAALLGGLEERPSMTRTLPIHGSAIAPKPSGPTTSTSSPNPSPAAPHGPLRHLDVYGADAVKIQALIAETPALAERLHADLPYIAAEVVWAARQEMARTVEDVLARRTRALFLNARAASAMAEPVAKLLAQELGRDHDWEQQQIDTFHETARGYLPL